MNEKNELLLYSVETVPEQDEEKPDGENVEKGLWERWADWTEAIDC